MNENYDRFKDLMVAGTALMIVGEVNNAEDKPKIFPTDIFPLEDAVKKFTKQVHIRMHLSQTEPEHFDQAFALTRAHPGRVPLFLHLKAKTGEWVFVEANQRFSVSPTDELQTAVKDLGTSAWIPTSPNASANPGRIGGTGMVVEANRSMPWEAMVSNPAPD
jgi:hypothetical protein